MPASSPGDPRALGCRYCGTRRRFVRRALVCTTCDGTDRWPGGALDHPAPPGTPPEGSDERAGEVGSREGGRGARGRGGRGRGRRGPEDRGSPEDGEGRGPAAGRGGR